MQTGIFLNQGLMVDVLRPLLCTWQAKSAERPPKVMKRSQRRNTIQISPRQDSNSSGSDLWSNALPVMTTEVPFLNMVNLIFSCSHNNKYLQQY